MGREKLSSSTLQEQRTSQVIAEQIVTGSTDFPINRKGNRGTGRESLRIVDQQLRDLKGLDPSTAIGLFELPD